MRHQYLMACLSLLFVGWVVISTYAAMPVSDSTSSFGTAPATGDTSAYSEHRIDPIATTKERFDICLGMLKSYYDAMDGRVEKSFGLLLVVLGWLITSETARKSLESDPSLFWSALITLTLLIIYLSMNIFHFMGRFREIERTTLALNYVSPEYWARYRMPPNILWAYIAPIAIMYAFIVIMLFNIRYQFLFGGRRKTKILPP